VASCYPVDSKAMNVVAICFLRMLPDLLQANPHGLTRAKLDYATRASCCRYRPRSHSALLLHVLDA